MIRCDFRNLDAANVWAFSYMAQGYTVAYERTWFVSTERYVYTVSAWR